MERIADEHNQIWLDMSELAGRWSDVRGLPGAVFRLNSSNLIYRGANRLDLIGVTTDQISRHKSDY